MASRVLDAVVRVRADTRQAQQGIQRMQRGWQSMTTWTQRLRAGMLGMNTMLMGQGAVMVAGGIAARSAIRNFEQYSRAQARIRGILSSSSADISYQRELMQQADASSRAWGHSLNTSATAMGTMLETGLEAHEAVNFYGVAAEFARAANTDLEGSTRVLVDAMRQFDDISTEGARNLASTITVASRISSTSVEELQQSLRYAGVELSAVGYEADETAAALGAMSAIGLRGTTAGTRLRGAILALTRITGRSRDVMTQYGLDHERLDNILTDETGSLRTMTEMTGVLQGIFQDLPTHAAKLNLATALFGRRAYAAGVVLGGLHERSDEFTRVLAELSDEELNQQRMQEAAEEQMHSFAAQMDLARRSAEELGVTFMERLMPASDDTRQGFGQWLTDLSLATRGAMENANMTEVMREQYEQLSPEMQQAGRDMRDTIDGLIQLLRALAQVGRWVGRLAAMNPQLAITFLFVGSAIRPLIPMLFQSEVAATASGAGAARAARSWRNFGLATRGSQILVGALIVDLAGRATQAINAHTAEVMGMTNEYERAGRQLPQWVQSISQLPVIGPWVDQYARLVTLTQRAGELAGEIEERRQAERESEQERVIQAATEGPEARRRAAWRVRRERLMRTSAMMWHAGIRSEEAVQGELARRGYGGLNAELLAREIAAEQQRTGGAGMTLREAAGGEFMAALVQARRGLGMGELYGTAGMGGAQETLDDMFASIRQMEQIEREALIDPLSARGFAEQQALARRVAQEEIGVRGGAVDISQIMERRRGELRTAMREGLEDYRMRTAPVTGATPATRMEQDRFEVAADLQIEIPVRIDGREIARAAGRHSLEIDERRGVTSSPGARRRTAESGVP